MALTFKIFMISTQPMIWGRRHVMISTTRPSTRPRTAQRREPTRQPTSVSRGRIWTLTDTTTTARMEVKAPKTSYEGRQ